MNSANLTLYLPINPVNKKNMISYKMCNTYP